MSQEIRGKDMGFTTSRFGQGKQAEMNSTGGRLFSLSLPVCAHGVVGWASFTLLYLG